MGALGHQAPSKPAAKPVRDRARRPPVPDPAAGRSQYGGLYVIHAMELRKKYRPQYEEAKRWRE